jgi:hypothetical protein
LVIIVPKDNRAGILTAKDLAKPGIKFDTAQASVPVVADDAAAVATGAVEACRIVLADVPVAVLPPHAASKSARMQRGRALFRACRATKCLLRWCVERYRCTLRAVSQRNLYHVDVGCNDLVPVPR